MTQKIFVGPVAHRVDHYKAPNLQSLPKVSDAEKVQILRVALRAAIDHLEYCGYGDNWERECAKEAKLPETLEAAMKDTE